MTNLTAEATDKLNAMYAAQEATDAAWSAAKAAWKANGKTDELWAIVTEIQIAGDKLGQQITAILKANGAEIVN